MDFNKDLEKLFQSHLKDFALQKILDEIFIIQYDFNGKLEAWPHFQALKLVLAHTDKTGQCNKK